MTRKRGTLSQECPSAFAFGESVRFLSPEEISKATAGERLSSVWPFILRQVKAFHATLKPQEAAVCSIEDALHEVAVAVLTRNSKWVESRGTYPGFVGRITRNALLDLRERSHTVQSPRNSSCRVREYSDLDSSGDLTIQGKKTWNDILRTFGDSEDYAEVEIPMDFRDIPEEVHVRDKDEMLTDAICEAMMTTLTTRECMIIGRYFGLWGQEPQTLQEIFGPENAKATRKSFRSAIQKLRATIPMPSDETVSLLEDDEE